MNSTSYHPFARFLHWTIVTLVAVQFMSAWLMPGMRRNPIPNFFTLTHLSLGLFLIPLALMLFFMRYYRPVAKVEVAGPAWMEMAASAMQYALYTLLVIVPLSGWASVSLRHLPINFFGLFNLPMLDITNPSFLYSLGRMHSLLATAIGLLALAHIAAALYHHFVLKDSVLDRMRPGRSA